MDLQEKDQEKDEKHIGKLFKKTQLTVDLNSLCSYHVTTLFQSESTLYVCLNVKELLA